MIFRPRDLLRNRKDNSNQLIDPVEFEDAADLKNKLEKIYQKPLYDFMIVDKVVYNGFCLGWVQDTQNV